MATKNFKMLWIDTSLIVKLIAVCHHLPKYLLEFVCYESYPAALLVHRQVSSHFCPFLISRMMKQPSLWINVLSQFPRDVCIPQSLNFTRLPKRRDEEWSNWRRKSHCTFVNSVEGKQVTRSYKQGHREGRTVTQKTFFPAASHHIIKWKCSTSSCPSQGQITVRVLINA